jgi:hypothetical protein
VLIIKKNDLMIITEQIFLLIDFEEIEYLKLFLDEVVLENLGLL